jgi:hypothetical protein
MVNPKTKSIENLLDASRAALTFIETMEKCDLLGDENLALPDRLASAIELVEKDLDRKSRCRPQGVGHAEPGILRAGQASRPSFWRRQ